MTATVRGYTSPAGFSDDFHRVRDFLVRINHGEVITPGFLWGRWEWMFSQPYKDTSALSRIGLRIRRGLCGGERHAPQCRRNAFAYWDDRDESSAA